MGTSVTKPFATWGVTGSVPDTCVKGVVQEISTDHAGIFAQEPDEQGRIIYQIMYDREETVAFTILVPSESKLPKVGSTVQIGSVTYVVKRCNKLEQNKDWQRIRVEGGKWVKCSSCENKTGETQAPQA